MTYSRFIIRDLNMADHLDIIGDAVADAVFDTPFLEILLRNIIMLVVDISQFFYIFRNQQEPR